MTTDLILSWTEWSLRIRKLVIVAVLFTCHTLVAAAAATVAPYEAACTSAEAASADAAAAATSFAARRQLATYPSYIANGSAAATFPAAAFGAWCATDAACNAASDLSLSLSYDTDATPYTSITLNWPNVFSGDRISALKLVSGLVELQFSNFAAKRDQLICSSTTTCTAQLTIPLTPDVDASQSFVCLRLEPSVTGSSYQAYGYPPGSYGTSLEGSAADGALRCNTNRFGKHIVLQYTQSASTSAPSPPLPSSTPPSPPPPPLNTTGHVFKSEVQLDVRVALSLGFDALKGDSALLSALTTSLETTLARAMATSVPQRLLLSSANGNAIGSLIKISRLTSNSTTAVSALFRLTVPPGATTSQVEALMALATSDTAYLFDGSPYTSYFMGSANVTQVRSIKKTYSTGEVVGISLGASIATFVAVLGGYVLYRWRAYTAILPKKPDGKWDPTGVEGVALRPGARQRLKQKQGERAEGGDPSELLRESQDGFAVSTSGGDGGGGLVAPWNGATDPHNGGSGSGGVKGEAMLVPSKPAWT